MTFDPRTLVDALQTQVDRGEEKLRLRKAKVTATSPLTIVIGGSTVPIPGVHRLTSYASPAVNDYVWVLQNGPDLLVIGVQA